MPVVERIHSLLTIQKVGRSLVSCQSICVLACLVAIGCNSQPAGDSPSSEVEPSGVVSVADSGAAPEADEVGMVDAGATDANAGDDGPATPTVTIEIVSFDQLQERIAAHKGKVVICDYWSTSCEPCVTELPHLVALRKKYPAERLVCLTASLDYEGLPNTPVESARDTALELLTKIGASTENVVLSEDSLTVLDEKLKVASMPVVQIFGTDGVLVRQFDDSAGAFTYVEHVNPVVEQLLDGTDPQPADE